MLETVPGLHVSRSAFLYGPKFVFRGLTSTTAPQTLILVDGISLKSSFDGDSNNIWGEYPIHAIARIEVLRGPGSALYGADAFSGVINIITKKHDDITANEIGISVGSFDTYNAWTNLAFSLGDWKSALSIEYLGSDGHKENITDGLGITGPVNVEFKNTDIFFNTHKDNWQIDLGWQLRNDVGSGQGILETLDINGLWGTEKVLAEVKYSADEWRPDVSSEFILNYMNNKQTVERSPFLLPPFVYPPDGLIGEPEYSEYTAKAELKNTFSGIDNHLVTVGLGYQFTDMYEVKERKNFNNDLSPKNGLEDVSNNPDEVFLPEKSRKNHFIYVQDEISLAQNWDATLGLRYDNYSDFGTTVNPRAALVWKTSAKLTTKFLYGEAFRAPSFVELFAENNPASLGDPNLKPENIETFDLAFSYRPNFKLYMGFNLFAYRVTDLLSTVPVDSASLQYANVGKQDGHGFELEFDYQLSNTFNVAGHYAFFKNKDKIADADAGDAPNHQVGLRGNWKISENVNLFVGGTYIGEQKRQPLDIRDNLSSYSYVDLSLSYFIPSVNTTVQVSGKNVFDADIREPSSAVVDLTAFNILNDLPQAGSGLFISLSKTF
ncbi:MAG: TonB-dependent receptor [Alteromonadaceae bacterium]|nr:TonB-dependent receptor [Alteromonadaceae bacterium]